MLRGGHMGRRAALMVLVLLVACGGDDSTPHPGGGGPTFSLGQACTELGQAACQRGDECGLLGTTSIPVCESQFVGGCCGGPPNVCGRQARDVATAHRIVDACASDLTNWDCQALSQSTFPVSCITPQ